MVVYMCSLIVTVINKYGAVILLFSVEEELCCCMVFQSYSFIHKTSFVFY